MLHEQPYNLHAIAPWSGVRTLQCVQCKSSSKRHAQAGILLAALCLQAPFALAYPTPRVAHALLQPRQQRLHMQRSLVPPRLQRGQSEGSGVLFGVRITSPSESGAAA